MRPVWDSLAARSGGPERSFIDDPAPHLRIDGRAVRPIVSDSDRYCFPLGRGVESVRLISRAARPVDERPWIGDRRRLGVCVSRIVVFNGMTSVELPLDHPTLDEGWWAVEHANGRFHRWTDGDAALPVRRGAGMLEVRVTRGLRYPLDGSEPLSGPEDARRDADTRAQRFFIAGLHSTSSPGTDPVICRGTVLGGMARLGGPP